MPLPALLWGAAALLGTVGVAKGIEASDNFDTAKWLGEKSEEKYKNALEALEGSKNETQLALEALGQLKLDVFSDQIKHLVDVIKKGKSKLSDFDIEISLDQLKEYENLVLKSLEIEASLGTGAVGGALAAMGAYGAVGYLGAASTGAAISGLSGAAATNATLAWLGGGALSAGGAGMAGGMLALGGIVLGPALAIGGFLLASQAEEALTKARAYEAKVDAAVGEMEVVQVSLKGIRSNAAEITAIIESLVGRFEMVKVYSVEDNDFPKMLAIGKALKGVLDINIIEQDGNPAKHIKAKCSGFISTASEV